MDWIAFKKYQDYNVYTNLLNALFRLKIIKAVTYGMTYEIDDISSNTDMLIQDLGPYYFIKGE
jgi:hypothetical protein